MPRVSKLTTRVAADTMAHRSTTLSHADDLADEVDRITNAAWKQVEAAVKSIRGPHHVVTAVHQINAIIAGLEPAIVAAFSERFKQILHASHDATADAIVRRVPVHRLRAYAYATRLTEETGLNITLAGPSLTLNVLDKDDLSDDAKRALLRKLIFKPPTQREAFAAIYSGDWRQRLAHQTKIAAPQKVAAVLLRGETTGQAIRERAKELLPVLNKVRKSARRIAHDETVHIAHSQQWKAWQRLGDMIAGYQVFAVEQGHSPRSRPEHRSRHGTVYWVNTKPGQKGLDELPNPPYEADGTLAYNCRCWIAPVFRNEVNDPEATELPAALDPEAASDWFNQSSDRDRRAAVGAEAYGIVRSETDREPMWADFVNESGQLLSIDEIVRKFTSSWDLISRLSGR